MRFPLEWNSPEGDAAGETEYLAWLNTALDHLDALLPAFQKGGIKVVVALYTPPGGFASRQEGPALQRIFVEKWAQDALFDAWSVIAGRCRGNTAVWGYGLLNEPAEREVLQGLRDWNTLARDLTAHIRAIDPGHPIMIEPVYGNQGLLRRLTPVAASGIVYSIHNYWPRSFTHQGVYGLPIGVYYPTKRINRVRLRQKLRAAMSYQKKFHVQIQVGEFTAARWAPQESAYRYIRDSIRIFEKNRWSWTYHMFRGPDVWSVEHGSDPQNHLRSAGITKRENLLRRFFAKNQPAL